MSVFQSLGTLQSNKASSLIKIPVFASIYITYSKLLQDDPQKLSRIQVFFQIAK